NHIHGIDAASYDVRSGNLNQRSADNNADHITGANQRQRDEREYEAAGNSEDDGKNSESRHAEQHDFADSPPERSIRQQEGHDGSPCPGRSPQQPQSPRSSAQNLSRINGKQSHSPAQQDSEQIQRNRTKDQFMRP